jgi:hypothetical protein
MAFKSSPLSHFVNPLIVHIWVESHFKHKNECQLTSIFYIGMSHQFRAVW